MLVAKITPRAGGFKLSGDCLDLESLHRSLHAICDEESDEGAYPENLIYQLAYDVRKAKDGMRDKTMVESFGRRQVTYHTVMNYLHESRTRKERIRALQQLPEHLRRDGPYARAALKARDEYASERGVAPESLGPAGPDEEPKF